MLRNDARSCGPGSPEAANVERDVLGNRVFLRLRYAVAKEPLPSFSDRDTGLANVGTTGWKQSCGSIGFRPLDPLEQRAFADGFDLAIWKPVFARQNVRLRRTAFPTVPRRRKNWRKQVRLELGKRSLLLQLPELGGFGFGCRFARLDLRVGVNTVRFIPLGLQLLR